MSNNRIIRFSLMLVVAVMAVASCISDIMKESSNGSAIDFRIATKTRATELTGANIQSFYVTARTSDAEDNYFTDVPYMRAMDEYFKSSTSYYWPAIGELTFYAYSPSLNKFGGDAELAVSEDSQKITGFRVDPNIPDQKDFITSVTTATKQNSSSGVVLNFDHKLSQIEIRAKNSNAGYNYSVKGVKISGVASKADFNFSPTDGEPEWEIDESAETIETYEYYNSANLLGSTPVSIMGPGGNAMLIPQELTKWDKNSREGAYIAVYAQVTTAEGAKVYPRPTAGTATYDWLLVPIDANWEAGYKYVYTLDFSNGAGMDENGVDVLGEAIEFSLNIEPWTESSANDISSIKQYLNGSWEIYQVQSYRDYREGYEVDEDWPEEDLYDTEEELSVESKVAQALRWLRVKNDTEVYVFPGKEEQAVVPYWIEDGCFCFPYINDEGEYSVEKYNIVYISSNEYVIKYEGDDNKRYHLTKIYYYRRVKDGFPLLDEKEEVLTTGTWKLTACPYKAYNAKGEVTAEGQLDWNNPDQGVSEDIHFLTFSENKVYFNTEEETYYEMEDNYSKFVIKHGEEDLDENGDGIDDDDEIIYIDRLTFSTMRLKITYYSLENGELVGKDEYYPFYTKVN